MRTRAHDVLIVDRLLPGIDGLAIIETLRRERIQTPVLVLSALAFLFVTVLSAEEIADHWA